MEVLLIDNVASLGARGDVVTVKDGYARNYLLPRKLALPVTAGNKRQIELEKARAEKIRATELAAAQSLKEKLEQVTLAVDQVGRVLQRDPCTHGTSAPRSRGTDSRRACQAR